MHARVRPFFAHLPTTSAVLIVATIGAVLVVDGHASTQMRHRAVAYVVGAALALPLATSLAGGARALALWRRLALSLTVLAAAFGALEWATRRFHLGSFSPPGFRLDDALGHAHVPFHGAIDAWGFRNRSVPERADVVCIGDSQTYGDNIWREAAYPQALGRRTGWTVYNMSMGGYGPLQMEHLVPRALELSPRVVVLGFYLGNDLADAYRFAALPAWSSRRDPALDYSPPTDMVPSPRRSANLTLEWIDRAVARSLVLQRCDKELRRAIKSSSLFAEAYRAESSDYGYSAGQIRTLFAPDYRFGTVDLSRAEIRDGLRITELSLRAIGEICHARGVEILLLIVPTKERVYEEFLAPRGAPEAAGLLRVACAERAATRCVLDIALVSGMRTLDPTERFVAALAEGRPLWPQDIDGHLNAGGCALIAELLAEALVVR